MHVVIYNATAKVKNKIKCITGTVEEGKINIEQ